MNSTVSEIISSLYKNENLSPEEFSSYVSKLDFKYPQDYLDIIKEYNGIEGQLGNSYIAIWPTDEVMEVNSQYNKSDKVIAEKYFVFGSNSGIYNYAFNKSDGSIIELDMYDESYAVHCGNSILELLTYLNSKT